ncbi:hypothetical protein ASS90_12960 [Staphylococcus saprophyticus]|nr:hypothetical protein ASS90_12960 [Staphylococcus saprophyticus]
MEIIIAILNILTKVSMFVILLLPIYIIAFYLLKFIFEIFKFYNIHLIKITSFLVSVIIIFSNVKFLDIY